MHMKDLLTTQKGDDTIVTNVKDFDIGQTLESGQCFRFVKIGENEYDLIAYKRKVNIKQDNETLTFSPCTTAEFETIWKDYFDLNVDYGAIKATISKDDIVMQKAIAYASGIHLINQEVWECLISFIISQNNNITRIKKIVETICEKYGEKVGDIYAFPTPEALNALHIDELIACRVGFRAKYIKDAASKFANHEIVFVGETEEVFNSLNKIHGVGTKVANCILLFSLRRKDIFPIDVWIKRVMQNLYFQGELTSNTVIQQFAKEQYGEFAGYAQQYLFHYVRTNKEEK